MELWGRQAKGNAKHEWLGKESSYISKVTGCQLEKETDRKSWRTARRQKDHNCEKGKLELEITGISRPAWQILGSYLVTTKLYAPPQHPSQLSVTNTCDNSVNTNICGTILQNESTNRVEIKISPFPFFLSDRSRWINFSCVPYKGQRAAARVGSCGQNQRWRCELCKVVPKP